MIRFLPVTAVSSCPILPPLHAPLPARPHPHSRRQAAARARRRREGDLSHVFHGASVGEKPARRRLFCRDSGGGAITSECPAAKRRSALSAQAFGQSITEGSCRWRTAPVPPSQATNRSVLLPSVVARFYPRGYAFCGNLAAGASGLRQTLAAGSAA